MYVKILLIKQHCTLKPNDFAWKKRCSQFSRSDIKNEFTSFKQIAKKRGIKTTVILSRDFNWELKLNAIKMEKSFPFAMLLVWPDLLVDFCFFLHRYCNSTTVRVQRSWIIQFLKKKKKIHSAHATSYVFTVSLDL